MPDQWGDTWVVMGVEEVVAVFEVDRGVYGERDGLGVQLGVILDPIHG